MTDLMKNARAIDLEGALSWCEMQRMTHVFGAPWILLGQQQTCGQSEHHQCDGRIEHTPGSLFAEQGREQAGAVGQGREPHQAGACGTGAEYPAPGRPLLIGQRAKKYHRIQIHMRIQEGETEASGNSAGKRHRSVLFDRQLLTVPCALRREGGIGKQEGCTAIAGNSQQGGAGLYQCAQAGDANGDECHIRQDADERHRQAMLAADGLPQDKGILGANGNNEHQAGPEASNKRGLYIGDRVAGKTSG